MGGSAEALKNPFNIQEITRTKRPGYNQEVAGRAYRRKNDNNNNAEKLPPGQNDTHKKMVQEKSPSLSSSWPR
ncbi:hypothetical protein GWI33_005129 [Rhynchophorus ferrugineus]|uniref:Uncharacterized protein n=1 Tax=Rhynchophorus ferrugineus TaxID=354439 RepID=A0A834IUV7_RHYFE|nr:hypothetical protein GWI33_005129 [Rhynchophorus ferrugineus]